MKLFAVYARVELSKKPDWLSVFREKYDEPFELHVTLKQPCYFLDDDRAKVERILGLLVETQKRFLQFQFDELVVHKDATMIGSRNADALNNFQKELCASLAEYTSYVKPEYREYEEHFWPHITIAQNMSVESYQEALEYLNRGDHECAGLIREVVLVIVPMATLEEATRPENQTVFHFG